MKSVFALIALMAVQSTEPLLEGHWRNPRGSVTISIAACGQVLCGRVESASDKAQADARRAGTDPLIGTELLSGLAPSGQGRWTGRIFVPDLNKRSRAELRLLGPDLIKVKGCAIGGLVCKSEVWARANSR